MEIFTFVRYSRSSRQVVFSHLFQLKNTPNATTAIKMITKGNTTASTFTPIKEWKAFVSKTTERRELVFLISQKERATKKDFFRHATKIR